jgi:hypothetical protein
MNNTNLENESLWAHRLPVKTKIYRNKITVLGIVLYGCIALDGNWIL